MGPKRSLMIKNCSVDNFGPFLTALDPYGMLTSYVGQIGHFWANPALEGCPQRNIKLTTRSPVCSM